jgi:hypothetical protein
VIRKTPGVFPVSDGTEKGCCRMAKTRFGGSPFSSLYHLTRRKTDWRNSSRPYI